MISGRGLEAGIFELICAGLPVIIWVGRTVPSFGHSATPAGGAFLQVGHIIGRMHTPNELNHIHTIRFGYKNLEELSIHAAAIYI